MTIRESQKNTVASAAVTSSSQSAAIPVPVGDVSIAVDVTAVTGTTPSMALTVEWSHDAGTTWFKADPADAFTAITAAGKVVKRFPAKAPHCRVVYTITGTTPSFTFAVHVIPI